MKNGSKKDTVVRLQSRRGRKTFRHIVGQITTYGITTAFLVTQLIRLVFRDEMISKLSTESLAKSTDFDN